jgi:hypothetical protein
MRRLMRRLQSCFWGAIGYPRTFQSGLWDDKETWGGVKPRGSSHILIQHLVKVEHPPVIITLGSLTFGSVEYVRQPAVTIDPINGNMIFPDVESRDYALLGPTD